MTRRFTVLVPTYNRPLFVERLLRYFVRTQLKAPILIADGSLSVGLQADAALVARYRGEGLDLRHYIPPADPDLVSVGDCRFGYFPRLNLAINEVATPFVHLLCDDCFASPEFFAAAVGVLDDDPATSTVIGQLWTINLDRTRATTATYGNIEDMRLASSRAARPGKTALQRLVANAGDSGMNTLWSMHRQDNLAAALRAGQSAIDAVIETARHADRAGPAEEWALDYLHGMMINIYALIAGTIRYVPHLMLGHQHHAENWGLMLSRGPRLNEAVMRPYWAAMSYPYIESAAGLIAEKDGAPLSDARTVVQAFLWTDMARRMSYAADLRLRTIGKDFIVSKNGASRTLLKQIPGLRAAARTARKWSLKHQESVVRRREQSLRAAQEITVLREFIENDPAVARQ